MIEVKDLAHRYENGVVALEEISLRIREREKVVLLGANGCGKTTFLKILDGLVQPSRGEYLFRGTPVTKHSLGDAGFRRTFRGEVSLLFQNPDVMLFNPTVLDEIAFGPRRRGWENVEERARKWAEEFGLTRLLGRAPFELSRGEKQKVCLAALLVTEPRLLLLDDPTANLDPRSTGWLVDYLQEVGITTVVSTHNLSLAPELGERTLLLSEQHALIYDGAIGPLAADREKLIEANLVHIHKHRHRAVVHEHFHTHDWE